MSTSALNISVAVLRDASCGCVSSNALVSVTDLLPSVTVDLATSRGYV